MGGEAPEPQRLTRALSLGGAGGVPEEALHLVMGYVDDPCSREAAALVCHRWHRINALTQKHITVPFCYAACPSRLLTWFSHLEPLAVKGKHHASMYSLIPDDWGMYAQPWLEELATPFECLKALHLRRMVITDVDFAILIRARGHMLQELKLDNALASPWTPSASSPASTVACEMHPTEEGDSGPTTYQQFMAKKVVVPERSSPICSTCEKFTNEAALYKFSCSL